MEYLLRVFRVANRSKRLRKKLYLDEFSVFGFQLSFDFKNTDCEQSIDKFLDDVIEFVKSKSMCIGGGIDGYIVCKEGRYDSIAKRDINIFTKWMSERNDISNVVTSDLINAHYPHG